MVSRKLPIIIVFDKTEENASEISAELSVYAQIENLICIW